MWKTKHITPTCLIGDNRLLKTQVRESQSECKRYLCVVIWYLSSSQRAFKVVSKIGLGSWNTDTNNLLLQEACSIHYNIANFINKTQQFDCTVTCPSNYVLERTPFTKSSDCWSSFHRSVVFITSVSNWGLAMYVGPSIHRESSFGDACRILLHLKLSGLICFVWEAFNGSCHVWLGYWLGRYCVLCRITTFLPTLLWQHKSCNMHDQN